MCLTFCGTACCVPWRKLEEKKSIGKRETPSPHKVFSLATFHVTGMTCGGCEVGVRRVVGKLDGVEEVKASYKASFHVTTDIQIVDPGLASADTAVILGLRANLTF